MTDTSRFRRLEWALVLDPWCIYVGGKVMAALASVVEPTYGGQVRSMRRRKITSTALYINQSRGSYIERHGECLHC